MTSVETNQVITFVPNNKKQLTINHRYFSLRILDSNLLKIRFTKSNEEEKDFIVRCIDAENLAEVIQISFFDNNESMEIENIEVYIEDEAIIENDRVSQSLVPIFKNIVDPHTEHAKEEEFTLTLNSLVGEQHVINISDIKCLSFNNNDIYITIITKDKLYRIIACNCKSIYPILEEAIIVNPCIISLDGIVVISCTLDEFREDNFKYSISAQVCD